MVKVCLVIALAQIAVWGAADSAAGGTISGNVPVVKEANGPRAVITWTRQTTIGATKLPPARVAATDEKGQFVISGLAGGAYALCTQIPNSSYVDPCVWNETLPQVKLETGGKVSGVKLELVKGVKLQVVVEHSEQKLYASDNKSGANLFVSIPRPHGPALRLSPTSSAKGQRTYEAIVPEFVELPVLVDGLGLAFHDEEGNARGDDRAVFGVSTHGKESKQMKISVKGR
jgi:hypothetical protein